MYLCKLFILLAGAIYSPHHNYPTATSKVLVWYHGANVVDCGQLLGQLLLGQALCGY